MINARQALSKDQRTAAAEALKHKLLQLPQIQAAQHIAFYWAVNGECDPALTLQAAHDEGKQCYLPTLQGVDAPLVFTPYIPGAPCTPNIYGIPEPVYHEAITAKQLDCLIMPCLAVTEDGARIGMGGGFYDRTLQRAGPTLFKIAIVYQFQVIDSFKEEEWDVAADIVVSVATD